MDGALGARPTSVGWLDDVNVGKVMLNPDGRLWINLPAGGLEDTGVELLAADGERIIRLVAQQGWRSTARACPASCANG